VRSSRIFNKAMQRYWRLTRALTLGAQAVVVDREDRVLLVRHTYRPGWHCPGGGVERHETAEEALARELMEETGVLIARAPQLIGLYANFRAFPSDHVALYLVTDWEQPVAPGPNREIAEHGFFARSELPADIAASPAARLHELFDGAPRSVTW
jgi:ADP-ribose pyrophosphatase YjhB (NUDIX family)